jgi:hypothetical protein
MKRILIIAAYSILVTLLLLLAGYRNKENAASVVKTDYSALWNMEQAKEAPTPQAMPKSKEATFKDKSMAEGIDATPSMSVG